MKHKNLWCAEGKTGLDHRLYELCLYFALYMYQNLYRIERRHIGMSSASSALCAVVANKSEREDQNDVRVASLLSQFLTI